MTIVFERLRTLALIKEESEELPQVRQRAITNPILRPPQQKIVVFSERASPYSPMDSSPVKEERSSVKKVKLNMPTRLGQGSSKSKTIRSTTSIKSVDDWVLHLSSPLILPSKSGEEPVPTTLKAPSFTGTSSDTYFEEEVLSVVGGGGVPEGLSLYSEVSSPSTDGGEAKIEHRSIINCNIGSRIPEEPDEKQYLCCSCFSILPFSMKSNDTKPNAYEKLSDGSSSSKTNSPRNSPINDVSLDELIVDGWESPKVKQLSEEKQPLALKLVNLSSVQSTHYLEEKIQELSDNPYWVEPEDLCRILSMGVLGRGVAGGVTAVLHIPTCNIYALKSTTYESEIETFVLLKRALGDKSAPHLMKLIGVFADMNSNNLAMVVDYMNLGSLHDNFTSRNRRCTRAQIKHIARESLRGLQTLHELTTPILHRDIKPNNILIESGGKVMIADYGLFECLSGQTDKCTDEAGTRKYFSPERHKGSFGPPADVWALGVTLVECWNGKLIDTQCLNDVSVASEKVSPLDFLELKDGENLVVDFLQCCLQPDPNHRWSATRLLEHEFLLGGSVADPRSLFKQPRRSGALLKEILTIVQQFIRVRAKLLDNSPLTEDRIWDHKSGVTHEVRLNNIVRWTGFSKLEVENHVNAMYLKRMTSKHKYNLTQREESRLSFEFEPDDSDEHS